MFSFFIAWGECMEDHGYSSLFKCKQPLAEMNECLKFYYSSKEFREECEKIYLEKRKKYRETGVIEKEEKRPYYLSSRKFNVRYPDAYEGNKKKIDPNPGNESNETKT